MKSHCAHFSPNLQKESKIQLVNFSSKKVVFFSFPFFHLKVKNEWDKISVFFLYVDVLKNTSMPCWDKVKEIVIISCCGIGWCSLIESSICQWKHLFLLLSVLSTCRTTVWMSITMALLFAHTKTINIFKIFMKQKYLIFSEKKKSKKEHFQVCTVSRCIYQHFSLVPASHCFSSEHRPSHSCRISKPELCPFVVMQLKTDQSQVFLYWWVEKLLLSKFDQ